VARDPDAAARAMEELYLAHASRVRAFVRRFEPDAARAEDVVQETFLRVWRQRDRLDADGNAPSYLLTTARNVLTDQWRSAARRPVLTELGDADEQVTARQDDTDRALTGLLVAEAVDQLSPAHREVVREVYFLGHSVAEAAVRLGVPEGTIKSRTYYAVRALRAAFEEMGVAR
jgi:RNA polymerase sigma-70 factor (ECF subfamily)